MNDKIINGIDVSECPLYDKNTGCYHTFNGECVQDSCAVYKWLLELKRLQQQIEAYQLSENEAKEIIAELNHKNKRLQKENDKLKANKGRCAFKCLDNTFCDEARIKIDKLELDKDCLNVSLETSIKYRGIAEADRDKYKQALEEIRNYCDEQNLKADYTACYITNRIDEVLNES